MTNEQWNERLTSILFSLAKRVESMQRGKTYDVEAEKASINSLVAELIGEDRSKHDSWCSIHEPTSERTVCCFGWHNEQESRSELRKVIGKSSKEDM